MTTVPSPEPAPGPASGTAPDGGTAAGRELGRIGVNVLSLVAQAAMPAYHTLLARTLGAGGYGLYTWSNNAIDALSLFTLFGMDQAVSKYVSQAHARDDRDAVHLATGTALRVVVLSGAAIAALVFLAAPALAAWQGKPGLVTPLRILALTPIFYHATTIFINATYAAHVMRYGFWARGIAQPLSLLVLAAAALHLGAGAPGACLAVVTGMAVTAGLSCLFYHRVFGFGPTLRAAVTGSLDRRMVRFATPLLLAGIFWVVLARMDVFVLGHYRGSAEVGAYAACMLYAQTLGQMRGAFDPVIIAIIPAALARGDFTGLRATLRRQTRWLAILAVPLFVLFAGFGGALLRIFGREFTQGATAIAVLSVGHLVNTLALASWVVPHSGRTAYVALIAGCCVVLEAGLLVVLVPRYGLTGAAIAAASSLATAQVTHGVVAWRIAGVHPLSAGLFKVFAAGAAGLAVGRVGVFPLVPGPLVGRFFAGTATAAVVYLGTLAALGLDPEEHAMLRRGRAQAVEAWRTAWGRWWGR